MEIRHKQVSALTVIEYKACLAANFGEDDGYMYEVLEDCVDGDPGEAIMIWEDDSLIGWALLTPCRMYGLLAVTRWVMGRSKYTVQVYVEPDHRRKGWGTVLMTKIKSIDPRPHVMPHDDASSELFSSFDVQTLKMDKHWLKRKPKVA